MLCNIPAYAKHGVRKSSLFGRGKAAYAVIIETSAQTAQSKAAWIGALVLVCTSAAIFYCTLGFDSNDSDCEIDLPCIHANYSNMV